MEASLLLGRRVIDGLLALLLATMVLLVFGNVVLRYAFNSGITVSEEMARWAFVWMTFIGAIVALREHGHLGTDVLVSRLPRLGKRICLALGQLLMIGATVLLLSGSVALVKVNLGVKAPVTGISMGVFYATGVVFAIPAAALLLRELWRTLTNRLRDDEFVMVRESEDLLPVAPVPR
jgi:TRAP-type C4-dicarboxylate transport system permease small subunit